ncbi:DEAD/DEAH box helicase [Myxococcota bacterium]|nr:DEAD/DEAH box helicase [Myxococcota bacterium]
MSVFSRFHPRLQDAIVSRLGFSALREVQELAGAAILAGENALVLAPTAGGKTEAAVFPVLSGLLTWPNEGVGALYVAPIKALLNNQAERLGVATEMVGLRRFVWHGDVTSHERRVFLKDPADVLMTTPESLEVMLISPKVNARALFADLRVVIIDEIHALAGQDRGAHLQSVLGRIAALSRHDVQRVGLSATVGNPDVLSRWLGAQSRRPVSVVRAASPPRRRALSVVVRPELSQLTPEVARAAMGHKSLFFCQSRATSEAMAGALRGAGVTVFVHHSAVSKVEREEAEARFHAAGESACIVCTSTLELGIDVGDLDRVLQAEAPSTVSSFLQRMGRTGRRAEAVSNTTFFCTNEDSVLVAVALVELARAGWVEDVQVSDRVWAVLIHQLLALALEREGVTFEEAWALLSGVPDLAGISRAEAERLVAWMLRDGGLALASGRLVLGPKAERRFGRKNFMELYAVFSSPQHYTVVTADGRELGTLEQDFVDRLVPDVSTFSLAGRAWLVRSISHGDRVVKAERAPAGRTPTWGGHLPSFWGFELAQTIRATLASEAPVPMLGPEAQAILSAARGRLGEVARAPGPFTISVEEGELRVWTFAGGRVNSTLKHALRALGGAWEVVADNLRLVVRGCPSIERLQELLHRLSEPELWSDEALWDEVAQSLPAYRLSKFQVLMPPWVERELLAAQLLDLDRAGAFCAGALHGPALRVRPQAPVDDPPPPADPDPGTGTGTGTDAVYRPARPVRWIRDDVALEALCEALLNEPVIALDVETTLYTHELCLIQVGLPMESVLIDPLLVKDLSLLAPVFGPDGPLKVIHHASFERSVLKRYDLPIERVFDTEVMSKRVRGGKGKGVHTLLGVCARELGITLDKGPQTSDWRRRPLSADQERYAAADVEVLMLLHQVFEGAVIG